MVERRHRRRGGKRLAGLTAALALAFSLLAATPSAAETVLLTSGDWPPYYSPALPFGGIANQVVSESFALTGVHVEFEFQPWRRALDTARSGKAAGSAGWLPLGGRERDFLYSEPVFRSARVFFHLKSLPFDWHTLDDIRDLRVAVTLGSVDEFPLEAIMARGNGKLDIAKDYASGMKKLILGRVDIYACNLPVGLFILEQRIDHGANRVTYNPRPIFTETNHLVIRRDYPGAEALMARFNEGLRQLKASGRYDRIMSGYPGLNLPERPPATPLSDRP